MTSRDRREFERVQFAADVEVQAGDEIVMLQLENISRGGALLACSSRGEIDIEQGKTIEAFIDLGSDDQGMNLSLCLEAEVVRFEDREENARAVGVRWISVSDVKADQLTKLMLFLRTRALAA